MWIRLWRIRNRIHGMDKLIIKNWVKKLDSGFDKESFLDPNNVSRYGNVNRDTRVILFKSKVYRKDEVFPEKKLISKINRFIGKHFYIEQNDISFKTPLLSIWLLFIGISTISGKTGSPINVSFILIIGPLSEKPLCFDISLLF